MDDVEALGAVQILCGFQDCVLALDDLSSAARVHC